MSRSSSQNNKEGQINQNGNQSSSSVTVSLSNTKNPKSINNFNNYINNKVSSIKEFTKKNILQLQNCINQLPPTTNENIQNIDNDCESLLPKDRGINYNRNNSNISENEEITNIQIIPATNLYSKNNHTTTSVINNENTNEHTNNNVTINTDSNNNHILRKNSNEESFSDFQNTIFNSDQYSPEYDFLIQLLSIPNDNSIIKHAIQHRISYLQEYIDETRRYTQLSRNSKLKKSIIIQAITFFIIIIIIFKSTFFFDEYNFDPNNNDNNNNDNNDNNNDSLSKWETNNIYNEEKIYLLKLLGILLLFYYCILFII